MLLLAGLLRGRVGGWGLARLHVHAGVGWAGDGGREQGWGRVARRACDVACGPL